ncbi:hypothetical protein J2847_005945 [Azospirillum agricola]|uniref:DUF2946 family protein n=1 Tax=Azospirillum agricola TaxID=1720247 RepID=UPI002D800074|nr:DUF2946 family protein [Azospirillum agricola]MBP2232614.1 hypothetical protein [Azospirillum agricola]
MILPRTFIDRIRCAGLLAGLLAFVVQMMVWSATMPAMALAEAPGGTETIAICSADGVKMITIGSDGQPDSGDYGSNTTGAAKDHCPLCPTMTGAGLPPLASMVVPSQGMVAADACALPGDVIAAGWFLSSLQARAPPAIG